MYLSPSKKPTNQAINQFVNQVNKTMTWSNDELALEDHYRFNRKYYEDFAPIYEGYQPAVILQTAIVLPFVLPFGENVFSQPVWISEKTGSYITLLFSFFAEKRSKRPPNPTCLLGAG